MVRLIVRGAAVLALAALVLLAIGYDNATSDPIVRRATVELEKWPDGAPPFTVLALSDVHVIGPDTTPARVERVVEQLNTLDADLIVVAGDLVSERRLATRHYAPEEFAKALAGLEAEHGVIIVPGNHDQWYGIDEVRSALDGEGIPVIGNDAVMRGPLRVGLVDDGFSGMADVPATFAALDALGGSPAIVVTHSPDVIPEFPEKVAAIFAGHTHCGQISLPLLGPVAYMSRYGDRFACGDILDEGQRIIVTAGIGTSLMPIRLGAPADVWLVTFGPDESRESPESER